LTLRRPPYDVAIVGAGVVGAAVAWRLSQEPLRVLWLEAGHDVAEGATRANSAIATTGYDLDPASLEAKLLRASTSGWEELCERLDVPFGRIGALALAFNATEQAELARLAQRAEASGVATELLGAGDARRLCPMASPEAVAGLHVPAEGIIDPLRLTVGYAEAAVRSGVDLMRSAAVTGFRHAGERISHVVTAKGEFAAGAVVNAAGLAAGAVSVAAGAEPLSIWPRKGQFLVLDRELGRRVPKVLTPVPGPRTRGVLAVPTTNGSLLLGPTADDVADGHDLATDGATLAHVLREGGRLLPGVERRHVIRSFAGLRPAADPPYRIERSALVPNLVQAAGLRSTGVSSSPAVAELVRKLLAEDGVSRRRISAPARLARVPRLIDLDDAAAAALAKREPTYRTVVCACEHVSAAEIQSALDGSVPPLSLDGVRARTRATGGRCQGAYCGAGVAFMLSMRQGLAPWEVTQGGPGTELGIGEA
jgi:glycerol-3-phosphate dehydrogenase